MTRTNNSLQPGGSIHYRYDNSFGAILFNTLNSLFLFFIAAATLYPFLYVLSISISNLNAVAKGEVILFPVGFDIVAYKMVFNSGLIMRAYLNTIYYSVSGVALSLFMLVITAYPLSIRGLYGRSFVTILYAITMFFGGGLIPTYLVVRGLGMIDTVWALIVPNAIAVFHLIIIRTNFQQIPEALKDSAQIDGANHLRILFMIYLPLSVPILAAVFLFIIVSRWNSFFAPLIYITDMERQPLQVVLRDILVRSQFAMVKDTEDTRLVNETYTPGMLQAIRAAAIIVSTGPILFVYPFIQRYFVSGVLIGSIKG